MTANHSHPQRETERSSAVEEAQSRQREDKVGKALSVGVSVLFAIPAIGLPMVFLVQWVTYLLRHGLSIVPFVLFLVAMMAVVAASHFLQYGKEGYALGGTLCSAASFVGVALILGGAIIGYVSQDWSWSLGTWLMGVGLVVSTIGLGGLAIVTLRARVLPGWGGAALIAANPFLLIIFSVFVLPILPGPGGGWKLWLVPVPILVVGYAVFLAARRLTERPARVR